MPSHGDCPPPSRWSWWKAPAREFRHDRHAPCRHRHRDQRSRQAGAADGRCKCHGAQAWYAKSAMKAFRPSVEKLKKPS